ncbi:hypothetical protein [Streptomyces profundus]|uniref:hypothetical protein n=1 Tax=Streptomyces profundus TaxID=2867410 RepID=UPI001D16E366|nr:hypothetical protein [Streptomyces sp. MA3_2.13]UED86636.1 hypothetical protein K4G22_22575 [Streptomyces sp. MA3_2.13]
MYVSRRRSARRWLTVVTFGALVLTTGCGQEEPADPATASDTATSAAPSDETAASSDGEADATDAADTSPSTDEDPWAGTKQFVQIDDAWTSEGTTYLSVRPAQKEVNTQFDTWVVVPGEGPYTTVPMAEDAQVLLTTQLRGDDGSGASRGEPLPYSQGEFVDQLTELDAELRSGIGYDLSFDGAAEVTRLQSLYTP